MKQQGFGLVEILVGVLILVLVGGGAYYLGAQKNKTSEERLSEHNPVIVPSQDETSDWKIYTISEYGFSFKYPADWKLSKEIFIGVPGEVTVIPPEEINTQAYRTEIAITSPQESTRYSLDTQQEFDEWIAKRPSDGEGQRLFKVADRLVDNIKAVEFVSRALPGDQTEAFYSTVVWFRKDNKNFYIEFGGQEEIVKRHKDTWNTILASVKFN